MIKRAAAQPSGDTLCIEPIRELVARYSASPSFDPFARNSRVADIRNDLNTETQAEHHLEAGEFLSGLEPQSYKLAIFDPPYSTRQTKELYNSIGLSCKQEDTQASAWTRWGEGIRMALKVGGICIKCGWNSCRPFEGCRLVEMLIVCHGGMHNDTIVTVWEKTYHQQQFFERNHDAIESNSKG